MDLLEFPYTEAEFRRAGYRHPAPAPSPLRQPMGDPRPCVASLVCKSTHDLDEGHHRDGAEKMPMKRCQRGRNRPRAEARLQPSYRTAGPGRFDRARCASVGAEDLVDDDFADSKYRPVRSSRRWMHDTLGANPVVVVTAIDRSGRRDHGEDDESGGGERIRQAAADRAGAGPDAWMGRGSDQGHRDRRVPH
jgi:hypothetical protein